MAEEKLNTEVESSTFATPKPELTELERLQERLANFKVNITPAVAQFSQILMQQALQNPTKIEDLDAFVTIRNELQEGLDEYKNQVDSAQRRIAQLTEQHNQQKQMELARREQDLQDARNAERKRRKDAEEKARQLEAVLASHGISIDLDGDGKVGLQEGESAQPLDQEQQKTLKQLLDEKYPEQTTTSRAFEAARAKNPEPKRHADLDAQTKYPQDLAPHAEVEPFVLEVPLDSKGTDEFKEEVEKVEQKSNVELADQVPQSHTEQLWTIEDEKRMDAIGQNGNTGEHYDPVNAGEAFSVPDADNRTESQKLQDELEPIGYDANGSPTAEFDTTEHDESDDLEAAKRVELPPSDPMESWDDNKPVISDSNSPAVIEEELKKKVRVIPEENINDFSVPEEETEEIIVPTESELKGMTKSKIKAEALKLGFDSVNTKQTKSEMITGFLTSVEEMISDLQASGEFVSATEEENDTPTTTGSDARDGGYFKS